MQEMTEVYKTFLFANMTLAISKCEEDSLTDPKVITAINSGMNILYANNQQEDNIPKIDYKEFIKNIPRPQQSKEEKD